MTQRLHPGAAEFHAVPHVHGRSCSPVLMHAIQRRPPGRSPCQRPQTRTSHAEARCPLCSDQSAAPWLQAAHYSRRCNGLRRQKRCAASRDRPIASVLGRTNATSLQPNLLRHLLCPRRLWASAALSSRPPRNPRRCLRHRRRRLIRRSRRCRRHRRRRRRRRRRRHCRLQQLQQLQPEWHASQP
eukprot:2207031-Pleurochrysis_carterae.AAC.1